MRVEFGAGFLGSFLCSVPASCRRVALRVSTAAPSWMLGLVLMPLGNLASITSVGWIWYVCVVLEACLFGEYFLPCACSSFPERSEMFEEFVGIVDGLA
jgi:hypothetical protein